MRVDGCAARDGPVTGSAGGGAGSACGRHPLMGYRDGADSAAGLAVLTPRGLNFGLYTRVITKVSWSWFR